jgi:FKBP-type peptidyl-prolyl cis-trans isomerase
MNKSMIGLTKDLKGNLMKSSLAILLVVLLSTTQLWAAEGTVLKSQKDKVSYAVGVNTGRVMLQQSVDLDPDLFAKGLKDAIKGTKMSMTEDEMRQVLTAFQKEITEKQAAMMKTLGEKNKKDGAAFLAENKKKEGVKILPSGLQYKIIKTGEGKMPGDTDIVECHYRGTLIDGTEFDSSWRVRKTVSFKVSGVVIRGWTEALKQMTVGSKWQLFIPPELAYGERGAGNQIGPNATLIFDLELIAIK